eukprot:COSAG01_NODE_35322_length_533_cov_4.587558_1_plen_107_part_10
MDDAAKDFLGGTLRSGKGVEHRVVRDDVETHVRIDLLNELVHALTGELNFIAVIFGDLDGVVVDFHLKDMDMMDEDKVARLFKLKSMIQENIMWLDIRPYSHNLISL